MGPAPAGEAIRTPATSLRRRLGAASVISVAQLGVGIILQLLLPPTLLHAWADKGFALLVAIQGFAMYVSLADGGVQGYVIQRLAILQALGRTEECAALAVAALRTLAMLASAALVVVFAAFVLLGRPLWATLGPSAGVASSVVLVAFAVQIGAGATGLVLGGWSTALEASTGRYVRQQTFGLARTIVMSGSLLVLAVFGAAPGAAIIASAIMGCVFDCGRAFAARTLLPLRGRGDVPLRVWGVLSGARGSVLQNIATATQNGLQPVISASVSPAATAIAVPGRTLANAARTASIAISNVIWVEVARQIAAQPDNPARYRFWARNAPLLASVQLLGVGALAVAAPLVVPRWLPTKSDEILRLLPIYLTEQAVLIAAVPSTVLLQALGRFGRLGAIQLASATVSAAVTWAVMPRLGAIGFAGAAMLGTLVVHAPGLVLVEWRYWRESSSAATAIVAPRVALALLAAASGPLCWWTGPRIAAVYLFGLAALTIPVAIRARSRAQV